MEADCDVDVKLPESLSLDLSSTSRVVECPSRPISLSSLLFHLLRNSPEGSLSLSSLADRTGWSPKRLSVRLKSLEARKLLISQLRNRGRQFVAEYSLLQDVKENLIASNTSVPITPNVDSSSNQQTNPSTSSTKRLSDVTLSRRRVLLEKVRVKR